MPSQQSVPSSVRPGWSEYCANKRELTRAWHWAWKNIGRPHHGYIAAVNQSTVSLCYTYDRKTERIYKMRANGTANN